MNEQEKYAYYEKITRQFHFLGKLLTIVSLLALLSVPFAIGILYGAMPSLTGFLQGFWRVAIIYYPVAIVEFLTFAPMLGVGGSYLAFITGNLTNLKIPCAVNSRDIAGTQPGTPENEIVSTISIATSALVTMVVLFAGVMAITPLRPVLESPVLSPAFGNVLAALFGALGLKYFIKQPVIAVVPLIAMSVLCAFVPSLISQASLLLFPAGILALGVGWLLLKKDKLK